MSILLILLLKFFLASLLAITVFWIIQIRFGNVEDLDQKSLIVRLVRRRSPIAQQGHDQVAIASPLQADLLDNSIRPVEELLAQREIELIRQQTTLIEARYREKIQELQSSPHYVARLGKRRGERQIAVAVSNFGSLAKKKEVFSSTELETESIKYPEDLFPLPAYPLQSKQIH